MKSALVLRWQIAGQLMSDNEIDKLIASGLSFHDSGDVEAARDCYLKVLELDPRNSQALDLAGLLCMQCGESEAAKEFYKSAIEVDPDKAITGATTSELGPLGIPPPPPQANSKKVNSATNVIRI